MRLSIKSYDGLTHHIVRYWNYAATLNGTLACGAPWLYYQDTISDAPANCLHCAISKRSFRDSVYTNEDA